ncbi:MAG: gas vesicle protein [Thaumarchaeota archaeon]|nr:gas vesicle protein [Nitrososphaerota archaeon]
MVESLVPSKEGDLAQVVEKILEKGLVINADISVSVAGTELLGIKIRAALASFETAAKYGLEFPSGTNYQARGWKEIEIRKAKCPGCRNEVPEDELFEEGCPYCGWVSPRKKRKQAPTIIST